MSCSQSTLLLALTSTLSMAISIYTSASFLDVTHDCSSPYTPLHTRLLTYSSFASCHSLSLLTLSEKMMWQLSESNTSAAPSFINPTWEINGCAQGLSCSVVQPVPRQWGPSPHAASEGVLSLLGHQGEDNRKTSCPSSLLYFVPTQLALILSLSCCLDSTCLFSIFFSAWIWVWM